FTSEEVFIDEGGEEVLEEPAPTQEKMADENATPAVEPPIEETPQQPIANNEPDLQYEAKLYDIYSRFHSQAMSDEEWDYIAGAKLSEVYTIHKGDTLWDLSKTFFGDGNYWPKIWSVNSSIKNPHLIEPQNVIRFILGSENEPPMFTVTEGKSAKEETNNHLAENENLEDTVEDTQLEELSKEVGNLEKELSEQFSEAELEEEFMTDEEIEGIVIPPPETIIRPVTQVFPPSLPQWKSLADSLVDSSTIEMVKTKKRESDPRVILSYYIDENQPEGVGKIVGIEGGGTVAAQYQYVYIRVKKGSAREGDKFLVTYKKGPLRTENGVQEDAIIWEVQGQITVGSQLQATKKYKSDDFEVYRAIIDNSINVVSIGAELLRSDYTLVDINKKGRIPAVSGLIIGGEFDNKRNLLARESIAYMNIGSNEGVELGDILPIYSNRYLEENDPYVLTTKKPMGLIKVARVSEYYSTGYVVENNGSINVGDFIGLKDGFEKEYLGHAAYEKVEKARKDEELAELQSLLELKEVEIDPAETETYEYMDE
ncbi:MAG: LysM peptidoglycan-binding domain-containing protein, partial [Bdellovibrionales bacterium]|nr:LysM peptidoglycan-binding domain-containing protein [Bdellovibrionales bacterium]